MRPHEIFRQMSPELARELFAFLRQEDKEAYQTAISSMATQRKLRPVFILKKRPEEQYAWLHKTAGLKFAEGVDEHILQMWLMKARQPMLIAFLDAVGIEHDGEGAVEGELPETLDADKLPGAVDQLLEAFPTEEVFVYLQVFQWQKADGWEALTAYLEQTDRFSSSQESNDKSENASD